MRNICRLFIILIIILPLPFISHATEDPLKDMDLSLLTEETFVEEKPKFFSISGYIESHNQLRIKEMDEPVSLRQRLWLNCYLGHRVGSEVLQTLILTMTRLFGIGRMIIMRFTMQS